MNFIYSFLLLPLVSALHPLILLVAAARVTDSKFMQSYLMRHRWKNQLKDQNTKKYWFHAASGEIESIKPLIRKLIERGDASEILITHSSISALRLLEEFKNQIELLPLPLDFKRQVQSLIHLKKPQIFCLSKTDYWPNLLKELKAQKCKLALMGFDQLSPSSKIKRKWLVFNLSFFDSIICTSKESKDWLDAVFLPNKPSVSVIGDPRWDQADFRLKSNRPLTVKNTFSRQSVFAIGSSWPEDETALLAIASDLKVLGFSIIWAPHEIDADTISKLRNQLVDRNLTVEVWSQTKTWSADVLLIDKIGVLAEVYSWAQFAFVGGSFKAKVHSVLEPLVAGAQVIVGPYYRNNAEARALIDQIKAPFCVSINNGAELLDYVKNTSNQKSQQQLAFLQAQLGATSRALKAFDSLI